MKETELFCIRELPLLPITIVNVAEELCAVGQGEKETEQCFRKE
jgi:hypothetical protein